MSTSSKPAKLRDHDGDPMDTRALRRSRWLRVVVTLRRNSLTHELAAGGSRPASPELTLRAAQLIGLRARRQLVRNLRRLLKEARQTQLMRATIIDRRAVVEAEEAVNALIARLSDNMPVAVQGMAMLELLLTDGASSPLYNAAEPDALRRQIVVATETMDPEFSELPPVV